VEGVVGRSLVGAGLIVFAAACYATLGPLTRFAEEGGVDALILVTWRAAVGAVLTGAFVLVLWTAGAAGPISLRRSPAAERWLLAATALVNALLNLSVFAAFGRITIALALLLFYLYPAGVALASVVWFGERLDRLRWVALGISLIGLVLVLVGGSEIGALDGLGVLLAFLGGAGQVAYVLLVRHGFSSVPAPQAASFTMAGAALLYLAIAALLGQLGHVAQPLSGAVALGPVLAAGVIGAGIPTIAYMTGIRMLGAPRAAILATLEPVIGVGLAAWLLNEQPALVQVGGGVLILFAAVLLQLERRGAVAAEHEAVAAG
jgi:drug/metabolite transporter (DMT)-like permease